MSWRSRFHPEEAGEPGPQIFPPDKIAVGDVKSLVGAFRIGCHPRDGLCQKSGVRTLVKCGIGSRLAWKAERQPQCRQGISRPQCTARPQAQNLHLRSETRRDAQDQTSVTPPGSRRTRDRPSQSRASNGPKLSLVPPRRRCQRHPRSCRLQLPPPDPLAQAFVVPDTPRPYGNDSTRSGLKQAFFTDDEQIPHRSRYCG